MRIIKGNKKLNISKDELFKTTKKYSKTIIDLGTGDGRFVYKKALEDSETLCIGIDPAEKQMREFSKKANRKKLKNALFVVGSFEQLPEELEKTADEIYINYPWGSLLEAVAKPTKEKISKIKSLFKNGGVLYVTLGYSPEKEPTETERLDLPELSEDYIKKQVIPEYEKMGGKLINFEMIKKSIRTTWEKRLMHEDKREFYSFVITFT